IQKITPCLWFDDQAEQAAKFYTEVFKNSRIKKISRYGKEGYEIHHRPEGSVMTVEFELDARRLRRSTADRYSNSMKRSRFRLIVRPRKKSITTGKNFRKAETKRRNSAVGSRTNTVCRGRSCRVFWSRCSMIPTPRNPSASWRRCSR